MVDLLDFLDFLRISQRSYVGLAAEPSHRGLAKHCPLD
jgi:hypothetical protein